MHALSYQVLKILPIAALKFNVVPNYAEKFMPCYQQYFLQLTRNTILDLTLEKVKVSL